MATLTAAGVNFSDGTVINGTGFQQIGSYASLGIAGSFGTFVSPGAAASGSVLRYYTWAFDSCTNLYSVYSAPIGVSGTWRYLQTFNNNITFGLFVRIS